MVVFRLAVLSKPAYNANDVIFSCWIDTTSREAMMEMLYG
jgi:hypothetical protein